MIIFYKGGPSRCPGMAPTTPTFFVPSGKNFDFSIIFAYFFYIGIRQHLFQPRQHLLCIHVSAPDILINIFDVILIDPAYGVRVGANVSVFDQK